MDRHACHTRADIGALPYFVGVWETVAAIGLARFFPDRYDLHFPKDIQFARHAMAIDEYRADFVRVPWRGSGTVPNEKVDGIDRFEQIWFAGDHSDVGGSYPENKSRLSDIALKWMAGFVSSELPAEGRLVINPAVLRCYPSAEGMMHDECMVGIGGSMARLSVLRLHCTPPCRLLATSRRPSTTATTAMGASSGNDPFDETIDRILFHPILALGLRERGRAAR